VATRKPVRASERDDVAPTSNDATLESDPKSNGGQQFRLRHVGKSLPPNERPESFVELYHWCESKSEVSIVAAFQSHLQRLGCSEAVIKFSRAITLSKESLSKASSQTSREPFDHEYAQSRFEVDEAKRICLRLAESRGELPMQWMEHVEPELRFLADIPLRPLTNLEAFYDWLTEFRRQVMNLTPTDRDNCCALRIWIYYEQAAFWLQSHGIDRPVAPEERRKAIEWFSTREGNNPKWEPAINAIDELLRLAHKNGELARLAVARREATNAEMAGVDNIGAGERDAGGKPAKTILRDCDQKAGRQYDSAMEHADGIDVELKTYEAAFNHYCKYLRDDGEKLPLLSSWKRFVSNYLKATGRPKYSKGKGIETRSVVRSKSKNRTETDRI